MVVLEPMMVLFNPKEQDMIQKKSKENNRIALKKMTWDDARRIQRHADKTGTNQEWKAVAMKAAARNEKGE